MHCFVYTFGTLSVSFLSHSLGLWPKKQPSTSTASTPKGTFAKLNLHASSQVPLSQSRCTKRGICHATQSKEWDIKIRRYLSNKKPFPYGIHGTGISTYWMVDFYMVNAGKYTIHGWYGIDHEPLNLQRQQQKTNTSTMPTIPTTSFPSFWCSCSARAVGWFWLVSRKSMTRNLHTLLGNNIINISHC